MDDFKKMEDFVDHVRDYVHVRVDEARLGAADRIAGVISSLITALSQCGLRVKDISTEQSSLEDIFVELVGAGA